MALGILSPGVQILSNVIALLVTIFIGAWILQLAGKIFKEKISYKKGLGPATIIGIVGFLIALPGVFVSGLAIAFGIVNFVVVLLLYLFLPKMMLGIKKGVVLGLVWWVFMLIVGLIIALIVGLILAAIFMASVL
ncbi:hypothetical protein HN592_05580 [Candidatus Woesearchaeota archaeon]|nr:hypothetical protein [Candidatus Woesearchaeota archaeon]MBT3304728.1 hypothetical protein [Candidatus Woesearchaeota archaeon]MBT4367936.1 hypothetical protein [Candidatus Woesearchaeota archaeon]MBT4712424.1 hypothetical protein [Candidatus Woesearchaeota archaeon]MBT6639336.1 hypothetical protein [Candidatus Woesearchaeota archaeon]